MQLREWVEFFQLEPWGFEVDWLRTGAIAAMQINTAANRKSTAKMFKPSDFVPKMQRPEKASRVQNARAMIADFKGAFGDDH